jgi:hypothetical protein
MPPPHPHTPQYNSQVSYSHLPSSHCYLSTSTYVPSRHVSRGFYSQDGCTPRISVAGESDAPRGNCGVVPTRNSHPRGFTPRPPLNGWSPLVKAHPPRSR